MSVKQIGLSGLCWLLCGLCWLHAQAPSSGSRGPDVMPPGSPFGSDAPSTYTPGTTATSSGPLASAFAPAPAGTTPEGIAIDEGNPSPPPPVPIPLGLPVSPYLTSPRSPCCCGNVGSCGGPINTDLFARSGWAFPVGQGVFNQFLHAGWDIEGGGRILLFNPPSTAAWTGTLSISNIFARTGNANLPIKLYHFPVSTAPPNSQNSPFPITERVTIPELEVTVSSLNMTFANIGFGREWWLLGSANPGVQGGCNWRVGCDTGGRWGSAMVQFNQINHHTDVVGGMYGALYSDISYPFRCAMPFLGVRLEYNYIWSSILQDQNNGNFSSINLLLQMGVHF
ncbi:MAG: hypothetical protein ACYC3I_17740 [Gemmataceae bacterium]